MTRTIRASRMVCLFAALIIAPTAGAGQESPGRRVHVGDSTFGGTRVGPFSGRWRVLEVGTDGTSRESTRYRDSAATTTIDGRQVLRQVQHTTRRRTGFSS